jgi:hypothetical protein
MAPVAFDVLFVLALVLPVLAVLAGPLILLVPTRVDRTVPTHGHVHAHP